MLYATCPNDALNVRSCISVDITPHMVSYISKKFCDMPEQTCYYFFYKGTFDTCNQVQSNVPAIYMHYRTKSYLNVIPIIQPSFIVALSGTFYPDGRHSIILVWQLSNNGAWISLMRTIRHGFMETKSPSGLFINSTEMCRFHIKLMTPDRFGSKSSPGIRHDGHW